MTIPTLAKNVTDAQMIAETKDAYSILQSIVSNYRADTGGDINNIINPTVSADDAADIIGKYVNVVKKCTGWDYTGCLADSYKYADGSGSFSYFGDAAIVLKNGITLGIFPYSSGNPYYKSDSACNTSFYGPDVDGDGNSVDTNGNGDYSDDWHYEASDQQCGHLFIDVNGPKGPNQLDKDAYFLIVTPYGNIKYWDYESNLDYVLLHNKLPPH